MSFPQKEAFVTHIIKVIIFRNSRKKINRANETKPPSGAVYCGFKFPVFRTWFCVLLIVVVNSLGFITAPVSRKAIFKRVIALPTAKL